MGAVRCVGVVVRDSSWRRFKCQKQVGIKEIRYETWDIGPVRRGMFELRTTDEEDLRIYHFGQREIEANKKGPHPLSR